MPDTQSHAVEITFEFAAVLVLAHGVVSMQMRYRRETGLGTHLALRLGDGSTLRFYPGDRHEVDYWEIVRGEGT